MSKQVRYYAVASLAAVLVTLVALAWFYRQMAIQGIVELTERNNLILARTALGSMHAELLDFLHVTGGLRPEQDDYPPLPLEMVEPIRNLLHEKAVVRVKLFSRKGVVVFSTTHDDLGKYLGSNQGFVKALEGQPVNNLVYRDTFNYLDGITEDDNLMQTYLPVRASLAEPVVGVFEIYTDVNHLVEQTEHTEFIIIFGALIILTGTYYAVILAMWQAARIIDQQQRTITERGQTLEALYAQMLKGEESSRKQIAHDLHEGLAQTLSAIKLHVENLGSQDTKGNTGSPAYGNIVPVLRDAIDEVRCIATKLRPSSIDDIGLLRTLDSHIREVERQHPSIKIGMESRLQEQDIPSPLKAIIYRIAVSVLMDMAQYSDSGRISLELWRKGNALTLMIDDTADDALDLITTPLRRIDPKQRQGFARMEELTTLSGGEFRISYHAKGGAMLHATWRVMGNEI